MKLGSSKSPSAVLNMLTGEKKIHTDGLLEYFKPLMEWLQAENRRTKEYVGFKVDHRNDCQKSRRRKRSLEYLDSQGNY